ncbi:MAG TPA: DEAD/DEAH box helicase family protein [Gemmatimonadaceae bacterium]|nr:DEAD/DEAH box helicase family protein [Gemmatimonadaceae bacterium]
MPRLSESDCETLVESHLTRRGWDLTDFEATRKRWRESLDGSEADRVFLHDGAIVAILEAKREGGDLYSALEQAKGYALRYRANTGKEVALLFASDGTTFLKKNLKANTLPERIPAFPTPKEFHELFNPEVRQLHGTLRDYQRVAVSQVTGALQSGRRRMFLQMATGTGKTITAAAVIAKAATIGKGRRALFLVDRDALAVQTAKSFERHLGDNFTIRRATGDRHDMHGDVLISTIQHLAANARFQKFAAGHFGLVFLDECHRSYFGEWRGILEYFEAGGAALIGLTATPSDNETVSTDRFFSEIGQNSGPIYRYTIKQGETNPAVPEWERLAACVHHKFMTNVDLEGVHDMGFDFEPEQLGRAVDVPQRNEMIARTYFDDILGTKKPTKTIVFAASIAHARNLRYAIIAEYNRRNNLAPNDASAERFIVSVHNQMPGAREIIEEFQKITDRSERDRIIQASHRDAHAPTRPIVLVGVGMLDTGIDAPDVEVLLMARPTRSRVLYVQMKGRGTRKCQETGKTLYRLVDFVDLAGLEPLVTNDTAGVEDEYPEIESRDVSNAVFEPASEQYSGDIRPTATSQEMVIADVPVYLVFSETLSPAVLDDMRRQVELQLRNGLERETTKQRFVQSVMCWRSLRGSTTPEVSFMAALGFDLPSLRDLYGEPEASLDDFVSVALGETDFETIRREREFGTWANSIGLSAEGRSLVMTVIDFRIANPSITGPQLLRSQWLDRIGGIHRIKAVFGSMDKLVALTEDAIKVLSADAPGAR